MASDGLSDLDSAAWSGFLRTHDRLWRVMETRLAPLGVSMAEYSVLALLADAGPKGMRMSELAEQRLMSKPGFSRLADRLEERGLMERRRSPADGRSFDAVLTREGRALLRRAWRRHRADLKELFFDHLDADDLNALASIWHRLGEAAPGDPR